MTRLLTALAVLACAAASPVLAQTSLPHGSQGQSHGDRTRLLPRGDWSFTLGAGTDNRSKDASKSQGDPYAYGSADWEGEGGLFYAGAGAETIDSSGSTLQLETFVGVQPELAGFDLDLSVTRQWRIDADPGTAAVGRREQQDSVDYTGWNAGVTWAMTKTLNLDLRWYDTNADPGASEDQYGSALVADLSYAF
jgi:hypothetical protein